MDNRVLLVMALKALTHPVCGYGLSVLLGGYLVFAPVVGKWNNARAGFALAGGLPAIAAAVWLGGNLDRRVGLLHINNRLGYQWKIDRMADDLNMARAQFDATVQQITTPAQQFGGFAGFPALDGFEALAALPEATTANPLELQTEDLAQTAADSPEDEQNLLIVGKSRSGKTTFTVNAIARKNSRHHGDIDWFIFNGKPEKSNNWGGLKHSRNDYWEVNSRPKAVEMHLQMKSCIQTLQGWQSSGDDHTPMVPIFDEVNNQRILLGDKRCKSFDDDLALYCTQCMSEMSGLWLISHSHNVEDVGLNRKLQQSFQMVVLGRNGKYESISAALDDHLVIRDKATRDHLKAQLANYIAGDGNGAIAFTNLGGSSRLVALPAYSKDITIQRGVLNQSTDELLADNSPFPDLENAFNLPAVEPDHERFYHSSDAPQIKVELEQDAIAIVAYSQKKGWVSVRDVQRGMNRFKAKSADEIKELFLLIEFAGQGITDSSQDALKLLCLPTDSITTDSTDR